MKWGVTMGTASRTFENKLFSCSHTWTSPKSKSSLPPPTTLTTKPTLEEVKTNEEVVVTDWPGGVANDPVNPPVQNDNPPTSPKKILLVFLLSLSFISFLFVS